MAQKTRIQCIERQTQCMDLRSRQCTRCQRVTTPCRRTLQMLVSLELFSLVK